MSSTDPDPNDKPKQQPSQEEVGFVELGNEQAYQHKVDADIKKPKASTENRATHLLVAALILSLPTYLLLRFCFFVVGADSAEMDSVDNIFERWLTIIGPLAGAAIGFGIRGKMRE